MSRTAPVIGMMLLLAVAVHLAPSEFPFLSLQQGLSLQASWVPLKPYAGAVHPMFLSLSRLVPVGDISFRAGLSPLWAWLLLGVLMTGLDRRRS